ncbi:30S ribosomal protein S20 [Candidatus Woesebacteria bacterium]|nr:30S ribosomal protein S20 [Candidatus Woesebacteria bacterium]
MKKIKNISESITEEINIPQNINSVQKKYNNKRAFLFEILVPINYNRKVAFVKQDMPITKTAKRALRSSKRKQEVNKTFSARYEVAIREAKNKKTKEAIKKAMSLIDKAEQKNLIHKNKAARLKSRLSVIKSSSSKKDK